MNSKTSILKAYRSLLLAVSEIESYNFRDFAYRRIRHQFKTMNKFEPKEIEEQLKQLNRIALVQNMYHNLPIN
jgi:hypothetical protein